MKPLSSDTVVIRGRGTYTRDLFYKFLDEYEGAELWTLNDDFDIKRSVRHFDMHEPRNHLVGGGDRIIEVVDTKNYPLKEIEDRYGFLATSYINNTISYMVFYAGLFGAKRVCLCGCDYNLDEIRQFQLSNLERACLVIQAHGVELVVPPIEAGGLLFTKRERYGYKLR